MLNRELSRFGKSDLTLSVSHRNLTRFHCPSAGFYLAPKRQEQTSARFACLMNRTLTSRHLLRVGIITMKDKAFQPHILSCTNAISFFQSGICLCISRATPIWLVLTSEELTGRCGPEEDPKRPRSNLPRFQNLICSRTQACTPSSPRATRRQLHHSYW